MTGVTMTFRIEKIGKIGGNRGNRGNPQDSLSVWPRSIPVFVYQLISSKILLADLCELIRKAVQLWKVYF